MTNDQYRWVARFYDGLFGRMNSGLWEIGLRLLPPRPGMTVLEIGCGTGALLDRYRERGCTVFGIDLSPAMLEQAHRRGAGCVCLGDASRMPFCAGRFDVIVTSLVLHEMSPATRSAVLKEAALALTEQGRILVIDYHKGPVRSARGWLKKLVIIAAEIGAGRRHYGNYRNYMALGGLPGVITGTQLAVEEQKIVGAGTFSVSVLRWAE
ncbi:class I SAM-dependent methyltransferase [Planctomycetota bacterium]